jgi:ubiquinone biosynthesis UbiH/UbiF/VisC/COQ6 family hydroxylase
VDAFDLIIVGAGLVGLSLARALQGSGLRLALVDRAPAPNGTHDHADWDSRVYAISPGSEAFLRQLGAWPEQAERIAPVYEMYVFGDAEPGALRFSAYESHIAHLACIVEGRLLTQALWKAQGATEDLTVLAGEACEGVVWQADAAELTLASGKVLRGRLLVGADGGESWLRGHAGIEAKVQPYEQTAVVANFACEHDHRGVAYQWFRADGVLALLPLPERRASMVWSARTEVAQELMGLDAGALCERVQQAARGVPGKMELITPPAAFTLRLIRVERLVLPRLALVGDAAHNLHPLAGQGVNLGFQDAQQLAQVLCERGACSDVGELRLLRRYERARREEILAMTLVTNGLQRLFEPQARPLSMLRNWGMALVERAPLLKRALVRHALGS